MTLKMLTGILNNHIFSFQAFWKKRVAKPIQNTEKESESFGQKETKILYKEISNAILYMKNTLLLVSVAP